MLSFLGQVAIGSIDKNDNNIISINNIIISITTARPITFHTN